MARRSLRCIGNATSYETRALVAAVRACMAAFPTLPAGPYHVEFLAHYHGRCADDGRRMAARGVAHLDAHKMHQAGAVPYLGILVPRGITLNGWREVLWVIEHEIGHLIGWQHGPDYAAHDARYAEAQKAIPTAAPHWAAAISQPPLPAVVPLRLRSARTTPRADRRAASKGTP